MGLILYNSLDTQKHDYATGQGKDQTRDHMSKMFNLFEVDHARANVSQ